MKVGFIITAYDQKREVNFTVNMLRRKWSRTANAPISIVISGDPGRELKFPSDKLTRVTTLDDMVGSDFNNLVSTSIMKQIRHGMVELQDLERLTGQVDFVVHMHGDILLMNEEGFFAELERFDKSGKDLAIDTVGEQRNDYIHFEGFEIMPQLFVVRRDFIDKTGFMVNMNIIGDLETRSTEWALKGNLGRTTFTKFVYKDKPWPYNLDFNDIVRRHCYVVAPARDQWNLHRHYGGFAHFGNQLHYKKEIREQRNEAALKAYGLDLSSW